MKKLKEIDDVLENMSQQDWNAWYERQQRAKAPAILEATANHFNMTVSDLKGKSRKPEDVFPRQVAIYLLRKRGFLKLKQIGEIMGLHHATVIHNVNRVTDDIATGGKAVEEIMAVLKKGI